MLPFVATLFQNRRQKRFFDAIRNEDFNTVKKLLDKGEPVNQSRKLHPTIELMESPLYCALSSSSPRKWEMAQFLLSQGADPNGMGALETPFQWGLSHAASQRVRLPPETPYTSAPDLHILLLMHVAGGDANHPAPGPQMQTTGPTNPSATKEIERDLKVWLDAQKAHFLAHELENQTPSPASTTARPRF